VALRSTSEGRPDLLRGVALLLLAGLVSGCGRTGGMRELVLASTTSVEDAGLLDILVPAFEAARSKYTVKVVAVGSGQAFALGRRGDADVLLTHAPGAEAAFVADGHGPASVVVMYNPYVLAGPAADPAGVRSANGAADAFRRIAETGSAFISRGDDSGTHTKERELWELAGTAPGRDAAWYIESGVGMADALRLAGERRAYVLTDGATLTVLGGGSGLDLLFEDEGDAGLSNPYAVTVVTAARNATGAREFAEWLRGPGGQSIIARYGADTYDRPLFVPVSPP
jgi:tungstate transport system substrate-binding protein